MFIMKLLLGPEGEGAVILEMSKSTQSSSSPPPPPPFEGGFFIWGVGGVDGAHHCVRV
jgi:hypothetical protein